MSTYVLLIIIWATTPLAIVWSVEISTYLRALALRFFLALPLAGVFCLMRQALPYDARSIIVQLYCWFMWFYWLANF